MLAKTFYDQIPTFVDRNNSLVGYDQESLFGNKKISEYEIQRSKRKEETLRIMNERIIQYTYHI